MYRHAGSPKRVAALPEETMGVQDISSRANMGQSRKKNNPGTTTVKLLSEFPLGDTMSVHVLF